MKPTISKCLVRMVLPTTVSLLTLSSGLWSPLRFQVAPFQELVVNSSQKERSHSNHTARLSYPSPGPAARSQTVRPPFDPIRDLQLNIPDNHGTFHHPTVYSSVRCVSSGSDNTTLQVENPFRPHFVRRTCRYHNLYYRPADQTFHYLASPTETQLPSDRVAEMIAERAVSIGYVKYNIAPAQYDRMQICPWLPQWHAFDDAALVNKTKVATLQPSNVAFLLYKPSYSFNFGHLLFDDMLTLFTMLDIFDLGDSVQAGILQPVPFHVENSAGRRRERKPVNHGGGDPLYRCTPGNPSRYDSCVRMYRRTQAALLNVQTAHCNGDVLRTGNWLQGAAALGRWPWSTQWPANMNASRPVQCDNQYNATVVDDVNVNAVPLDNETYVLLPTVVMGTGQLSSFGCVEDCMYGRGPQLLRYRNFLWRNIMRHEQWFRHLQDRNNPSTDTGLDDDDHERENSVAAESDTVPVVDSSPPCYITFSLPVGSSRPHEVHEFAAEIAAARQQYGADQVRAVNMTDLSLAEQARLVHRSAVLFTNHGGGSAVSIFLPRGATAMVYWQGKARRDHWWYESVSYHKVVWMSAAEAPNLNRTMAMVAYELHRMMAMEWPNAFFNASTTF